MSVPSSRRSRRGAILVCFVSALPLVFGCSDLTRVSAPPSQAPTPPPPSTPTASSVIVYEGPPDLYDFASSYHNGSVTTHYMLYGDSTFALEFVSPRFGPFSYTGRYKRTNSRIVFSWNAWSAAGPWGAEATLTGDSLKVTYNLVMMMTDFVDGTYVRASSTP